MRIELQRHFDRMKSLAAYPDGTLIDRGPGRAPWARVVPIRCPICRDVFYTFGPLDHSDNPVIEQNDPQPPRGCGMRQTCGHPQCHKAEQNFQYRRHSAIRAGYSPNTAAPAASR